MARLGVAARLTRRARRAGVPMSDELVSRLAVYYELLLKWNKKVNLTAVDDIDQSLDRMLVEPVAACRYLPEAANSLLDIGSGGGSPAIPMKVWNPGMHLRMVESKTRKSAFLREAIRELGLRDADVETCRYEELLGRSELHEGVDIVTIRAVRVEGRMLAAVQAFLSQGGKLLWFRGPGGRESADIVTPPLEWEATYPLVESLRSRLVVVRKRHVGR